MTAKWQSNITLHFQALGFIGWELWRPRVCESVCVFISSFFYPHDLQNAAVFLQAEGGHFGPRNTPRLMLEPTVAPLGHTGQAAGAKPGLYPLSKTCGGDGKSGRGRRRKVEELQNSDSHAATAREHTWCRHPFVATRVVLFYRVETRAAIIASNAYSQPSMATRSCVLLKIKRRDGPLGTEWFFALKKG